MNGGGLQVQLKRHDATALGATRTSPTCILQPLANQHLQASIFYRSDSILSTSVIACVSSFPTSLPSHETEGLGSLSHIVVSAEAGSGTCYVGQLWSSASGLGGGTWGGANARLPRGINDGGLQVQLK